MIGDEQFILQQIPSGILHGGATCVIGNGVVLDPETLFKELDGLTGRGVDIAGRLFVSDRAHLVLPYHKLLDAASEKSPEDRHDGAGHRAHLRGQVRAARRAGRRPPGRRRACAACWRSGVDRANRLLAMMGAARASLDEHVALLERLAPRLLPLATDTGLLVHRALRAGQARAARGGAGRAARRGPRHLSRT